MRRILTTIFIFFLFTSIAIGQSDSQRILFFGDSITAGLGVEEEEAFPALVQQKIDSLGWDFKAVNAGLSGETSAGGLRRVDWLAEKNDAALIPFLLEDVGRNPERMQSDGIHPNAEGHQVLAENAWDTLKPILQKLRTQAQSK